jgi:hypothetical protein
MIHGEPGSRKYILGTRNNSDTLRIENYLKHWKPEIAATHWELETAVTHWEPGTVETYWESGTV